MKPLWDPACKKWNNWWQGAGTEIGSAGREPQQLLCGAPFGEGRRDY